MKRLIITGILVLATGFSGLMAQKKDKKDKNKNAQQAQTQQAAPEPAGPKVKSPAEAQAVQALGRAQTADAVIAASEDLLTKFADTEFKDIALLMEARAYQSKGDAAKSQIFAERAYEANPKNYQIMLLLGELIAQHTGEHDFDRDEKLGKANKYLNDTIATVAAAPKPNAQLTDADWEASKKQTIAEAHNALGLIALNGKKYEDAQKEFQIAIDNDAQGAYQVRLASALWNLKKYDEAIAVCDKVMADAQQPPQVKQVAQAIKAQSTNSKAGK